MWAGRAGLTRPALQARPISAREKVEQAQECVVAVDQTQLRLGSKFFTFDAVYDGGSRQETIYDECVSELGLLPERACVHCSRPIPYKLVNGSQLPLMRAHTQWLVASKDTMRQCWRTGKQGQARRSP